MSTTSRSRRRRNSQPFYTNPSVVAWTVITMIGLLLVIAISGIT